MKSANTAASTNGTRMRSGRSGNSRTHRRTWLGAWTSITGGAVVIDMASLSGQPDAWVDVGVEDVDQKVHEYDHDASEHNDALYEREIALEDALVEQPPDAGPGEDHLDDDGGVHHHDQVDTDQRQYRHQRILEAVLGDDDIARQALQARELDVFAAHDLEHARASEAQQRGGEVPAERQGRHDEIAPVVLASCGQPLQPYG